MLPMLVQLPILFSLDVKVTHVYKYMILVFEGGYSRGCDQGHVIYGRGCNQGHVIYGRGCDEGHVILHGNNIGCDLYVD